MTVHLDLRLTAAGTVTLVALAAHFCQSAAADESQPTLAKIIVVQDQQFNERHARYQQCRYEAQFLMKKWEDALFAEPLDVAPSPKAREEENIRINNAANAYEKKSAECDPLRHDSDDAWDKLIRGCQTYVALSVISHSPAIAADLIASNICRQRMAEPHPD